LLPAAVTEFPSKGTEGTCEGIMTKRMWKRWRQNMGTQPQNASHAVNFHINNMQTTCKQHAPVVQEITVSVANKYIFSEV
jgi:hypothetical protein